MRNKTRVFIYNGYGIFGGSFMLYQLGLICYENFNVHVFIVQEGAYKKGEKRFHYKYHFPTVTVAQMMKMIQEDDLFICNPVQSFLSFGTRLPCHTLMYLQGVSSYSELDRHFDEYVSVSNFVMDYIKSTFGIDSTVIAPLVDLTLFDQGNPWRERSSEMLVLAYKNETHRLLNRLRKSYRHKYQRNFPRVKKVRNLTHQALAEELSAHQYYLTLTRVEGFGLPSLEAMASGCVVLGFDAYGGRDYFQTGQNAYVVEDGNVDRLADYINRISQNPGEAKVIAQNARATAEEYSFENFCSKWCRYLKAHVFGP